MDVSVTATSIDMLFTFLVTMDKASAKGGVSFGSWFEGMITETQGGWSHSINVQDAKKTELVSSLLGLLCKMSVVCRHF